MGIYVPLPENTDEVKYVVPPRSNFERRQPWIGRIKHAVRNTPSMRQASMLVGCDFKTFRKWAKLYGFWCPNQSGKGISKKRNRNQDICPLCNN
jgi:hypothetical protein